MCTWTIFPQSDWNQSDKRRKLHCLRGPSKKQSFWSEYNIHQSVCVWTTYSLEMLFGRFQSVSSCSWFVQHFTGIQLCSSFQYLVWMTSCVKPSNRRGINNLQQKTCIGYRPVLFCSHPVFASPGSIVTSCHPHRENIFIPTRERNDLNKCLHGWYFSIDWNLKGEPGLSIWLKINSRQAGSSHIWWEY